MRGMMKRNAGCLLALLLLILIAVQSTVAYEYPLSASAIRDAYFLGTGPKSKEASFYEPYTRSYLILPNQPPTSQITIHTPFLQVAEHARDTANYHAQDAAKEFFGKSMKFQVFLDIYFQRSAGKQEGSETDRPLQGVTITLTQSHKVIAMDVVDSWELYPFRDAQTLAESPGEHIELACDAGSIESAPLKVEVKAPDRKDYTVEFDLTSVQ